MSAAPISVHLRLLFPSRRAVWKLFIVSTAILIALVSTKTLHGYFSRPESELDLPAVSAAPPELPREWRWQRKAIGFNDMIREGGSVRQDDWISTSSQRARARAQ